MFTLLIALISSLFLFNPDGDRINNKVGDLAANQLLPGSPVLYVKYKYWDHSFDVNGREIYKDKFNVLKRIKRSVSYSDSGEELTHIEYEYYEDRIYENEIYLMIDYHRYYDSKGRLVSWSGGDGGIDYKYNDKNLVIEEIQSAEGDYVKTVYRYNDNGHCIYEAYYYTKDPGELVFWSTPESEKHYTILKVDKHGNWISRKSDKGEIEERTIIYRNYKSKQ